MGLAFGFIIFYHNIAPPGLLKAPEERHYGRKRYKNQYSSPVRATLL
jgi:hypothetical protein